MVLRLSVSAPSFAFFLHRFHNLSPGDALKKDKWLLGALFDTKISQLERALLSCIPFLGWVFCSSESAVLGFPFVGGIKFLFEKGLRGR